MPTGVKSKKLICYTKKQQQNNLSKKLICYTKKQQQNNLSK